MNAKKRYVTRVLARYTALPGTLHRVLRQDRRLAADLFEWGISLEIIENAFVLAVARRGFRSDAESLEPIRSLYYLLPVIQELLDTPPEPGYLQHLRYKLATVGIHLEA